MFRRRGLAPRHDTDIYFTALGMLLTLVYATGLLFRPQERIARRADWLVVLVLDRLGVGGLFATATA